MSWWDPRDWFRAAPGPAPLPQAPPLGSDPSIRASDAPGVSHGLLGFLRRSLGWPGARAAQHLEVGRELRHERVHSGPSGVVFPWFLPYYDDKTGETAQVRAAYRRMIADPNVKPALLGKALGIGALQLKINPARRKDPAAQHIAEFVRWNLTERLQDGFAGLCWAVLSGGLIDGYSISEKVWTVQDHGKYRGLWPLRALKPKDTNNDVVLETDSFRNVIGIKGLRYNAGMQYSPSQFLIFRHLPLYDSPVGMSDLRAAYSRYWMLDTATKLRGVAIEKRAMPFIWGTYQTSSQKPSLDEMLARVKSQNWASVPEGVKLEVLNIAGSADAVFKQFTDDLREEIFLSIQGATLQALLGGAGEQRGNSKVHKSTADVFKWALSSAVVNLLNDHDSGLVRDMVDLNFQVEEYPRAVLSAVDVGEMSDELALWRGAWEMGVDLSKEEFYETFALTPPTGPDDALPGRAGGAGGMGGPGPPGSPGNPGGPPQAPRAPDLFEPGGDEQFSEEHWLEAAELGALSSFAEPRTVGQPFQGPSGRWFVVREFNGKKRTVPHAAPAEHRQARREQSVGGAHEHGGAEEAFDEHPGNEVEIFTRQRRARHRPGDQWQAASGQWWALSPEHRPIRIADPHGQHARPGHTSHGRSALWHIASGLQVTRRAAARVRRRLGIGLARLVGYDPASGGQNPRARRRWRALVRAVAWVEHKVMIGFRLARQGVEKEALRHGASPDTARRVGQVLGTLDLALAWTVNMPLTLAATGSLTLAKASSWLPVASLGFLAFSRGGGVKLLLAARKVLRRRGQAQAQAHAERPFSSHHAPELVAALVELFESGHDPDWVQALLAAALDRYEQDHDQALAAVRRALVERPEPPGSAGPARWSSFLESNDMALQKHDEQHWLEAIEMDDWSSFAEVGQPFQGPSGRWFVVREFAGGKKRTVPAKGPQAATAAPARGKGRATATVEDVLAAVHEARAAAGKSGSTSPEQASALAGQIMALSMADTRKLAAQLFPQDTPRARAQKELAGKVADRALAVAREGASNPEHARAHGALKRILGDLEGLDLDDDAAVRTALRKALAGEEKPAGPPKEPPAPGEQPKPKEPAPTPAPTPAPADLSSAAGRAAAAASLPPGQRGGKGSALRAVMGDTMSYLRRLTEFSDGLIATPALYQKMKQVVPNLTPEEFKKEMLAAEKDRELQLHIDNEAGHKVLGKPDRDRPWHMQGAGEVVINRNNGYLLWAIPGRSGLSPADPDVHAQAVQAMKSEEQPKAEHADLARALGPLVEKGHGQVDLADLLDATGWSREQLHAAVNDLRRQGVLAAAAYEGRQRISDRQRAAAIEEPGAPGQVRRLGYVEIADPEKFRALLGQGQT